MSIKYPSPTVWRRQCFTLLEVLVASCIISIFLGVILTGFSTIIRTGEAARDHATASLLAQLKLNEILQAEAVTVEGESGGDFSSQFERFKWRTSLKKIDFGVDGNNGEIYAAQVEVLYLCKWQGGKSLVIESMLARPAQPGKPGQP